MQYKRSKKPLWMIIALLLAAVIFLMFHELPAPDSSIEQPVPSFEK